MKRFLLIPFLALIILLVACASDDKDGSAAPESTSGGQDATTSANEIDPNPSEPETGGDETGENETQLGISSPEPDKGAYMSPDGREYTSSNRFDYQEILDIFHMSAKDFKDLYGEPVDFHESEFYGDSIAMTFEFSGAKCSFGDYGQEYSFLFEVEFYDNKLSAPREIKIGDSLDSVIAKFPNEYDLKERTDVGDGTELLMLYGEWIHMQDFGYITLENQTPLSITYSMETMEIEFILENERVSAIRYSTATD